MSIVYTIIVAFVLALILGLLLGVFKKLFFVPVDEKVERVREALPGSNCGGCGYAGCDAYAAAVAEGAPTNACVAGGPSVAAAVAAAAGSAAQAIEQKVVVLACQGVKERAADKAEYNGVPSCAAAKIAVGGTKLCPYGCIGFGDCASVCNFGALSMGDDGLPKVDYAKCIGCGSCVKACPNALFALVPASQTGSVALCSNRTTNKPSVLKSCKAGCIKCGKCETTCPNGAIKVTNGVPVTDYAKCVSCGKCVAACPTKVLKLTKDVLQTA
ncbi:MAG: RnfABCDGE type electron transport complex subunit B [Treponemataceae bacterium]|nr:MAG: RnfABCDGE type electron transport complex subunit B [Treponemataceae bacterium]